MLREVLSFDLYLIVSSSGLLDITYLFFGNFFRHLYLLGCYD